MRRSINIILFLAFAVLQVQAQPPGFKQVADMNRFKTMMSAASAKTNSLKSDFVQEKNLEAISETVISKGTFRFKKPGRIRMEYITPFSYLMIINNNKVTIRDDKKTNSFSSRGNKLFTAVNNIILDCMQGTTLENKDFKSVVYENDNQFLVIMSPVQKELKDFFKNIGVYLDKKSMDVEKLEMMEPSADKTVITFTNRTLNAIIPDSDFIVK